MNSFEIKHLRMISTLAQTQNMTKAAEKLFISQSALSQQLKLIETRLNAALFFRANKKMVLTSTGKRVLQSAQQVIDILDETELEIAKIVNGEQGTLKIGTQCIFCYKWLPQVIKRFQTKFPSVEIEIGNSERVYKELDAGKFDFIITVLPVNDSRLRTIPLFNDQMVCIMSNDHRLASKQFIDYSDLSGQPLIFNSERAKNRFQKNPQAPVDIKPKTAMIVGQAQAIVEMVAAGLGLSFYPRWAALPAIEQKTIAARPVGRSGMALTWVMAHLNNKETSLSHQEFINIIKKMNIVM